MENNQNAEEKEAYKRNTSAAGGNGVGRQMATSGRPPGDSVPSYPYPALHGDPACDSRGGEGEQQGHSGEGEWRAVSRKERCAKQLRQSVTWGFPHTSRGEVTLY